ncbi:hypothetical protein [uncultured Psychroserpens sp.]|uniref:hypothetical protein n=1 Tax=uncultured Psychroserpens sp. TaxID=255436 RepID=UPI002638CB2E|nr:hypothetical protein [uncultured Psychroserpens sp.]
MKTLVYLLSYLRSSSKRLKPLPEDIRQKIRILFKEDHITAMSIISIFLLNNLHLNIARVIRCIIFLSDGNINTLKKHLEAAKSDARDVILWAEYENLEGTDLKRIRDFSEPFNH